MFGVPPLLVDEGLLALLRAEQVALRQRGSFVGTPPGDAEPTATTEPTATEGPTGSAGPTGTASPTAEPSTPAAEGCPATDGVMPARANTYEGVDVDGDGRPDIAWLTGGPDRAIGISTASGAVFSAPIDSASPLPASAVVNVVRTSDAGDVPIALVDVGREVLLYSVADCAVTATRNDQGEQYTFDKGFTGFGTGVGCVEVDGALRLVGLNAVPDDSGQTFTVSRTVIDLTRDATRASNGAQETVTTDAAAGDLVVTTARETSCGELVAGRDGPVEPS